MMRRKTSAKPAERGAAKAGKPAKSESGEVAGPTLLPGGNPQIAKGEGEPIARPTHVGG